MRHSFLRAVSVAVLYAVVLFIPISSFGKNNHSKKPTRSPEKTTPETVLLTSEGSALKVEAQISKDRRVPGLPTTPNASSPPPQAPSFRATGRPREDRLLRGRRHLHRVRRLFQISLFRVTQLQLRSPVLTVLISRPGAPAILPIPMVMPVRPTTFRPSTPRSGSIARATAFL